MNLNVNDDRQIPNPTAADTEREIRSLGADQYLILSQEEERYIQAYLNEDGTWDLEYRDGSAEEHYAADGEIDIESVVMSFQSYLVNDEYQESLLWLQMELPEYDESELADENGQIAELGEDGDFDWQEDIDASQRMPEVELKGAVYQRIAHGSETTLETEIFGNCDECNVLPGQLHVLGCEQEQCPLCQGYLMECTCLDLGDEFVDESDDSEETEEDATN